MTAHAAPGPQRKRISCRADLAPAVEGRVFCPRIGMTRTIGEHQGCPYCFGKEWEIQGGSRDRFCDYVAGLDAVTFGFPDTCGHFAHD